MRIEYIIIEKRIAEKILDKHTVEAAEIKAVLLRNPLIVKSKYKRYMAVGYYQRYLTVIFEYEEKQVKVITAYPSSEAQIQRYKLQ